MGWLPATGNENAFPGSGCFPQDESPVANSQQPESGKAFYVKEFPVLEKDIEDAFCEYIIGRGGRILKRELSLPFGRADVVGYLTETNLQPFIAEIKLGDIDSKAIVQLLSYTAQVEAMIAEQSGSMTWEYIKNEERFDFAKIVVGKRVIGKAKTLIDTGSSGLRFIAYSLTGEDVLFEPTHFDFDERQFLRHNKEIDSIIHDAENAYAEDALFGGIFLHDRLGGWSGGDNNPLISKTIWTSRR